MARKMAKKKRMSPRLKARRGRFGSPIPAQFKAGYGWGSPGGDPIGPV